MQKITRVSFLKMERPIRCLIYGGTSSLVAPLLRSAPFHYHFTLYTRHENAGKQITHDYLQYCQAMHPTTTTISFYNNAFADFPSLESVDRSVDRVLVFATKPDPALLAYLQLKGVPTLFIGSGSVTDALEDRMPWSEYSLNKRWPEDFATTTFRCGFFIPDSQVGMPAPPAGIGMDSAKKIWSENPVSDVQWLKKEMYATPVSFVVMNTLAWIKRENLDRWHGEYHLGTEYPLSRGFLRLQPSSQLVMPKDWIHQMLPPIYAEGRAFSTSKGILCPALGDIQPACERAAAWIQSLNKE